MRLLYGFATYHDIVLGNLLGVACVSMLAQWQPGQIHERLRGVGIGSLWCSFMLVRPPAAPDMSRGARALLGGSGRGGPRPGGMTGSDHDFIRTTVSARCFPEAELRLPGA